MTYSDFTLDGLISQFHLSVREERDYFAACAPCPISDLPRQTLLQNVPLALDMNMEKARSEFIIAPVLSEVRRQLDNRMNLFFGVEFTVDPDQGLRGVCDFLLSIEGFGAGSPFPAHYFARYSTRSPHAPTVKTQGRARGRTDR